MKLSIAMATYNGQRYLPEQLDSFVAQRRRPDEVIVCDDGSTDRTLAILTDFAATAPFPVTIYVNEERLGHVKNFEKAVGLCSGDVIFLSDQDDVWAPQKLERHESAHRDNPGAGVVFSDAALVDGELRPMGRRLWQHTGINPRRQKMFMDGRAFDLLIKRHFVYGIMLSFRSEFRDVLIPFDLHYPHDDWIALVMSALTPFHMIDEPLVSYRQHANQLVGTGLFARPSGDGRIPKQYSLSHMDKMLEKLSVLSERLGRSESRVFRKDYRRVIRRKRDYLRRRESMPGRSTPSKLLVVARDLLSGDYLRFGAYPKQDLLTDLDAGRRPRGS
jgi:glycosyltransferase involved in cell wall biosynthesis